MSYPLIFQSQSCFAKLPESVTPPFPFSFAKALPLTFAFYAAAKAGKYRPLSANSYRQNAITVPLPFAFYTAAKAGKYRPLSANSPCRKAIDKGLEHT